MIVLLILVALYLIKKELLVVIIFTLLDFAKSILKVKFRFVPVDLCFVFGFCAAYFYNPIYSLVILVIADFNRFVFGFFEERHFIGHLRDIAVFLIVPFFRFLPFATAGIVIVFLKYFLNFSLQFIFYQRLYITKLHFYLINIMASLALIYLIDMIKFILCN
ncbi:MAG: hypothetical protein V1859_11350 [archaeon]